MSYVKQLKIKLVNVHRNNNRHHAILQNDDTDILLIQEPSWVTVATLRSNTDPTGEPQKGAPLNNYWDCHAPPPKGDAVCKALTYTKRQIRSIIRHNPNHPLTNHNTSIIDITD
jgi:hypothetical protein